MTQPLLDRLTGLLEEAHIVLGELSDVVMAAQRALDLTSQTSPAAPSGPQQFTELSAHTVLKLNRRTAALLQAPPTRQGPVAQWIEPDAHGMAARDGAWGK